MQWQDWRWQLAKAQKQPAQLRRFLPRMAETAVPVGGPPLAVTPHFLSLIDADDDDDPLLRQILPTAAERETDENDLVDPLGETAKEAAPNLIHRYPDRALLLVTDRCAAYCRFCTRKRLVGQGPTPTSAQLDVALAYVREHDEVKEIILSGGDALVFDDEKLEQLLVQIRSIPSVDVVRIASRMLTFAPMRVTPALIALLRRHATLYLMSHFNHARELDATAVVALEALADGGIPVMNQTVLLRGVNDNAEVLATLFRKLVQHRARPYYLHQCDLAPGNRHFRVPLPESLALVGKLRGHLSGLCMPTFVVDIPGGAGKVPLVPDVVVDSDSGGVWLRGFDGDVARYPLD